MKFSHSPLLLLATLVASTAASPLVLDYPDSTIASLKKLQIASQAEAQAAGTTANEFLESGCRDVIFIFARGSTQEGNVGGDPGPQTIDLLKAALGANRVAAQGVEYPALLIDNLRSGGCDPEDAASMRTLIGNIATACPSARLVVSGYSQGAALVHRAVESASASVRARIAAAVTFGDTQRAQDGGRIPNFDPSRTLIICRSGDLLCQGTLLVTDAHYTYSELAPDAVAFIVSKV
ncbi:carbohydrate esterase family 5 protein [Durotheca rogersii]|uniref:carbohydrate esterase family 5 protein n=1 Tax=Durotheca rogersii TaxID=419775 RepID=UPI00221E4A11|nr:carbohydrate esterase family 5 protein [Durotheca rogersii]KAI5860935.1 carbohydrate esterase family 5 protein [Durotheca rogersii]